MMEIFTAIEGNICAGKTTLCRHIKNKYGDKVVIVLEEINPYFLQCFYKDPALYCFPFQLYTLSSRLSRIQYYPEKSILDRSLIGDIIFATTNYILGNIKKKDFNILINLTGSDSWLGMFGLDIMNKIDKVYYLVTNSAVCHSRAQFGRDAEKNVDYDYFDALGAVHFYVLVFIWDMMFGKKIRYCTDKADPTVVVEDLHRVGKPKFHNEKTKLTMPKIQTEAQLEEVASRYKVYSYYQDIEMPYLLGRKPAKSPIIYFKRFYRDIVLNALVNGNTVTFYQ